MIIDYLTLEERLVIFKILYPTMEFDSLMESGHAHAEELMDELGIPKHRNNLVHVISYEESLRNKIISYIEKINKITWGVEKRTNDILNINKHPKCKIYQCNHPLDPVEYDCEYMTKIDCDECKYNGRGGKKNPEAKCNKQ
jgi:hypothetical protein